MCLNSVQWNESESALKKLQVWSTNTWKLVRVGKTWVRLWLKLMEKSMSEDPKTLGSVPLLRQILRPLCSLERSSAPGPFPESLSKPLDSHLLYVAEKEGIVTSSQSWNPFHTLATPQLAHDCGTAAFHVSNSPSPKSYYCVVYNHPYKMDMDL